MDLKLTGELNLSKNMNANNGLGFYKVIDAVLIVACFMGFISPKSNTSHGLGTPVSLAGIIGYCRFLAGSKNQMLIDIAVHNIAIAIFGFIISFFSRGVLESVWCCFLIYLCL